MTDTSARDLAEEKAIDTAVGREVRRRRILLGLRLDRVARQLGLTFQQVQKYEHGTNRISASRLVQLARILHCQPGDFFVGFPHTDDEDSAARSNGPESQDLLSAPRIEIDLLASIRALGPDQKTALAKFLKTLNRPPDYKTLDRTSN